MKNSPTIGLIDTNTSNIKSVYYALKEFSCEVVEIKDASNVKNNIDAIVVPGIGNFSHVMNEVKKKKLDKFIFKKIDEKMPSLFICVGMQILFSQSYEFGKHKGLNIFDGEVKKIETTINSKKNRKVPFIGWNKIIKKKKCDFLNNIDNEDFFYFTHSYYVKPKDDKIISSKTNYLNFNYCSSISENNIFACQFHPEKSGSSGLKLYRNFINLI